MSSIDLDVSQFSSISSSLLRTSVKQAPAPIWEDPLLLHFHFKMWPSSPILFFLYFNSLQEESISLPTPRKSIFKSFGEILCQSQFENPTILWSLRPALPCFPLCSVAVLLKVDYCLALTKQESQTNWPTVPRVSSWAFFAYRELGWHQPWSALAVCNDGLHTLASSSAVS